MWSVRGRQDDQVSRLDPVGLDRQLGAVWAMNARADVNGLVGALRRAAGRVGSPYELGVPACQAVVRDLGILLGSVKRHGVEPVEVVDGLERILLELGERTGMVPRDTVHHYIRWNPQGPRERRYTGERMETILMSAVRAALPPLSAAVDVCRFLHWAEPGGLDFALAVNDLAFLLASIESPIDTVSANVTPEFFARTMRPYFEGITVGGVHYLGPAAAHVPLALVDIVLWAGDADLPSYEEFAKDSAEYGLAEWRHLYAAWAGGPSVVSKLLAEVAAGRDTPDLWSAVEAASRALRALVVFRGKHLSVARAAYEEELRLYPVGSGGASVDLLADVVALTKENAMLTRRLHVSAGVR